MPRRSAITSNAKSLDGGERLLAGAAVHHDSGERGDVGNPAAVGLAVELHFEIECVALAACFMRLV